MAWDIGAFEYEEAATGRQYGRPTSDVTVGDWTPSTPASGLYAMIDEAEASDTDYITSGTTAVVGLNFMNTPDSGITVLRVRTKYVS